MALALLLINVMVDKKQQDYKSPLFFDVDTQEDGLVIVTCNYIFKKEAEDFLSHLAFHLDQIFSIVMWDVFAHSYRSSRSNFSTARKTNLLLRLLLMMRCLILPLLTPTIAQTF